MVYSGAYSVVTSISVVGFYLSYIIPIYLGWRRKDSWILKRVPWHLGNASNAITCLAILWTLFICTIMVMPPNVRAGAGIATIMGVLLLFHLVSGEHKVHKPNWVCVADAEPKPLPKDQV